MTSILFPTSLLVALNSQSVSDELRIRT